MSEPPNESASERTRSRERTRVQEDAPVRGVSLDPEGQVPARDIAPNSSETGRAAAAVPEVSTSTGRIPRNQDEFQQQSNQSQRSSRSFISQVTILSVMSIISWISAKWTSMMNYWNGVGSISSDIIHIFNVIGILSKSEIKYIVEALGLISVANIISH